jgi:tetratricopeptide (TPR) repeat protein
MSLGNLGNAYLATGDERRALECYERDLMITLEMGDLHGEASMLYNLGALRVRLGAVGEGMAMLEQALLIARRIGARDLEAEALFQASLVFVVLGRRPAAIATARDALEIYDELESPKAAAARAWLDSLREG